MERANEVLAAVADPGLSDLGPAMWVIAGLAVLAGALGGLIEWARRSRGGK